MSMRILLSAVCLDRCCILAKHTAWDDGDLALSVIAVVQIQNPENVHHDTIYNCVVSLSENTILATISLDRIIDADKE